ncbi:MAG: sulfatase [Verrucomicrobiales bacterium]
MNPLRHALSAALALLCVLPGPACAAGRPNFLLIVSDDSTWSDFGFAGSAQAKTPNLDALREQGMYLSHMFTPATTCSPSRHALYTGLGGIRSGAYPNHTRVYDGTKSIFTYLKDAGYRVALQNKSHVGPKQSFPYENLGKADDLGKTKEFIGRDAAQPWLIAYCSNDPHSPWTRGPKVDPATVKVPPYLHDNAKTRELLAAYYGEIAKFDEQVGNLMKLLDETGSAEDTLVLFVSEQGSSFPYGGKWSVYDTGIRVSAIARWPGKIAPGSRSGALVSYIDVAPTFLAAAGIDPAQIDTGCPDADGARGFDGRSFLPLLRGEADSHRDLVFSQHTTVGINGYKEPYPMRAARDARYKLIRNLAPDNTYEIGGIHQGEPLDSWKADAKDNPALQKRIDWLYRRPGAELYDLQNDPLETKNLAGDPALAEVQARLQSAMDEWMAQQGDRGMETEKRAKERQGARKQEGAAKKLKKAKPE